MNRYSPFTFFGVLMIPLVFGVVHAQDNASDSSKSKDPFELMLNQAREEQRQKMLQDFTESQKENETQNMNKAKPFDQQNTGVNPNQPNSKTAPNSVAPHVAPGSSIPLPGTSATNSNEPAAPPANIYLPPPPPPGVVPPGQGSTQPPVPPAPSAANSAMLPPAAPPNAYG